MEGVGVQQPLVGCLVALGIAQGKVLHSSHHRIYRRASFLRAGNRFEEPPAQDLGHILAGHRLHRLGDAAKDVLQHLEALDAGLIVRLDLGGDEGSHQRRPIHFAHRLSEHLVKVFDGTQQPGVLVHQRPVVPYRLVHQDQRAQALFERLAQQVHQEGFGRHGEILVVAFEPGIAGIAGELVGQGPPGRHDPPRGAGGPIDLQPFLHVELVEGQEGDPGPGWLVESGKGEELADGGLAGPRPGGKLGAPFGQM